MAGTVSRIHPWLADRAAGSVVQVAADLPLVSRRGGVAQSALDGATASLGTTPDDPYVAIDALAAPGSLDALYEDLTALGLQGGATAGRVVSGFLPLDAVPLLEGLTSLDFASPVLSVANAGSVDSQGDRAVRADAARAEYGVDGSGVRVGVLSDSYNAEGDAFRDITSGDLPPDVTVLDDFLEDTASDEGRAMLQIVHDLAPGADLLFATAFGGQAVFARNIQALADAGADVIVDDVIYLAEPFFQDGIIAQAVDDVAAQGVAYFSSAGNSGFSSYEAAFRSTGTVLPGSPIGGIAHDWDPGIGIDPILDFTLQPDESVFLSLQWNQPFASISPNSPGADSDIDIYLVDPVTGEAVTDGNGNIFGGLTYNIGRDPVEIFEFENEGSEALDLGLVIENAGGPDPDLMKIVFFSSSSFVQEKDPEYSAEFVNSTVVGHAAAQGAIAVGASAYFNTPEFDRSVPIINSFSGRGPTTILRDIDGTLLPEPEVRETPDIVAPDGVDTTFFGSSDTENNGFPNFFGTSAAAPHAAAVAALLLDAAPGLTPEQILQILQDTAIDMVFPGFDRSSGAGLIQADAAVAAVLAGDLNVLPVAADDIFATDEDTVLAGALFADNGNGPDTDADGDPVSVAAVNGQASAVGAPLVLPSGAVLTVNEAGAFVYDPNGAFDGLAPGQTGSDNFTYTVTDGQPGGVSTPATVEIALTGRDDAPRATADRFALTLPGSVSGNVLADNGSGSDVDPEGAPLVVTAINGNSAGLGGAVTLTSGARVTLSSNGGFLYDPGSAFDGLPQGGVATDGFVYTVSDGTLTDTATVTVSVRPENGPPAANNDTVAAGEDSPAVSNVLDNDADTDGDALTVSAVNGSGALVGEPVALDGGGVATLNADGTVTFDPDGAFDGLRDGETRTVSLAYTARDSGGLTDTATVSFVVAGANDAPMARNDLISGVGADGVSGNVLADNGNGPDTDAEGDALAVSLVSQPLHGAVTLQQNGDFTYLPNGSAAQPDQFVYRLTDPSGATAAATVTLSPSFGNEAPIAADDRFTLREQDLLFADLLGDNGGGADRDPDGDILTVTAINGNAAQLGAPISLPSGAFLTVSPNGTFLYNPVFAFAFLQEGQTAVERFNYTVADGRGGSATGAVTITIVGQDSSIFFGTGQPSLIEGGDGSDAALVSVNRSGPVETEASVQFSVRGAGVNPASGADFAGGVLPSGELIFPAGVTERTILLPLADDAVLEGPEDFIVTLSDAATEAGPVLLRNPVFTATIEDDDLTDTVVTTSGRDKVKGDQGSEGIDGAGGNDTLKGRDGDDVLIGGAGRDKLDGGNGADALFGGTGDDKLKGKAGDDILSGGDGEDRLDGADGADRLDGGAGADRLKGKDGNDVFVFSPGSGQDTVRDFSDGEDRIDLTGFTDLDFFGVLSGLEQSGKHAVFTAATGDTLVLSKTDIDELDFSDFIFSV